MEDIANVLLELRQSVTISAERGPLSVIGLTSGTASPTPSDPAFSLLHLPAEILSEISASLWDHEKEESHYNCY